ncbi:MAG TPA: hypothetical protein V6C65_38865 [Allocoleopsis sp.]
MKRPYNYASMSPEDRALWDYLNAGNEFTDGGAAQYQWQGDIAYDNLGSTPQLGKTNLGGITSDQKLLEAQMRALAAMEEQADTGLSAADENALNRTGRKLASDANSVAQTIEQRMARQGRAGGRLGVTMQMQAAQAANQAAADQAADRNAMAQEGRLRARLGAGQMAGSMDEADYRKKANAAAAQDAIEKFNLQNTIGRQEYNNRLTNSAKEQNWQGKQSIANQNTSAQYDFRKDKMGVQQQGASAALEKANQDYNRAQIRKQQRQAKRAGVGSAIGTVAGGVLGTFAMPGVGTAAGAQLGGQLGGALGGFAQGGKIPGVAPFPGDDPRNDLYTAQVSADEIIVPRTAAQDPASAAAFAASAAADPFSSIKNPQVREYMRKKYTAQQELDGAQKNQEMLGYANIAGKALNDFANSQKEDVILKNNFLAGKNLKPDVIEAKRSEYDGSMLDRIGQQGVSRAQTKANQVDSDFDTGVKLDRYTRDMDAQDKALAKDKAMNDSASAESAAARDYLKTIAPGVAEKLPNFDRLTAAQLEKLAPGIWNKYKLDSEEKQKAADRASQERRVMASVNKPTAAEIKEKKEIRALEAGQAKEAKVFDDLRALRAGSNMTGPVAGRAGKALNAFGVSVSPEFDQMNARQMSMVNEYIKATTGASASEGEMKRLMAVMPDVADTDDLYENKMKALQETTEAIINERRAAAGLPPAKQKGATGDWGDKQSQSKKYDWED